MFERVDAAPPSKYMHCLSAYKILTNSEQLQIEVHIIQFSDSQVGTLYARIQQPNFTEILGHLST